MGVKYFFKYLKDKHSVHIQELRGQKFSDRGISVNSLLMDMNGVFHTEAQSVYKYGNKKPAHLLPSNGFRNTNKQRIDMYKKVCESINKHVQIVRPTDSLILCVDGPAPLSKQNQQRQRRFRAGMTKTQDDLTTKFDSNCLTPGTKFMDSLTKYIHIYIQYMITFDSVWKNLKVLFSNEKVAGEGEQKLMTYIRKNPSLSYCIVGLDADLIFLSLATHVEKFYVLREDMYNPRNDFLIIDIGGLRKSFISCLSSEEIPVEDASSKPTFEGKSLRERELLLMKKKSYINDFVFMCFAVGNDFLPHVPCIEILENGMEILIEVYKKVVKESSLTTSDFFYVKSSMKKFYEIIASQEKEIFEDKLSHHSLYFPDRLLEGSANKSESVRILQAVSVEGEGEIVPSIPHAPPDGKFTVDMEKYSKAYYQENFPTEKIIVNGELDESIVKKICHEYLRGLQWVLQYYMKGVPSWNWRYPYHYAPFAHDICKHIDTFEFRSFEKSVPTVPFIQLMSVLPPSSKDLLPAPLCDVITEKKSEVSTFFPSTFNIDFSGKRQEWEGIVCLPMVDYCVMENLFFEHKDKIDVTDLPRNRLGHSYLYESGELRTEIKSFFENFTSTTKVMIYDFCDV